MSVRFLADENLDRDVIRGLFAENRDLDILRVQDVELTSAADPAILEWAAREGRVLLTHDNMTMPGYAYDRVRNGAPMPGVFVVPQSLPVGQAIQEILVIDGCSVEGEWQGQVRYLPL